MRCGRWTCGPACKERQRKTRLVPAFLRRLASPTKDKWGPAPSYIKKWAFDEPIAGHFRD